MVNNFSSITSYLYVAVIFTLILSDIFHFDGAAWISLENTKQNGRILAFWGESTSNLFVVGDNWKILKYVD